jgi:hypothetical protein
VSGIKLIVAYYAAYARKTDKHLKVVEISRWNGTIIENLQRFNIL